MKTKASFLRVMGTILETYSTEALEAMGFAVTLADDVFEVAVEDLFEQRAGGLDEFYYFGIRVRRASAYPHRSVPYAEGLDKGHKEVLDATS